MLETEIEKTLKVISGEICHQKSQFSGSTCIDNRYPTDTRPQSFWMHTTTSKYSKVSFFRGHWNVKSTGMETRWCQSTSTSNDECPTDVFYNCCKISVFILTNKTPWKTLFRHFFWPKKKKFYLSSILKYRMSALWRRLISVHSFLVAEIFLYLAIFEKINWKKV